MCIRALVLSALVLMGALGTSAQAQVVKKPKFIPILNDTGMTLCATANGHWTTSCAGTGQDGESGRDVSAPLDSDGYDGYSYVKVCNNGEFASNKGPCLKSAKLGAGLLDWGCTYDKVRGTIWELKTNDGSLRDYRKQYTNLVKGQGGHGGHTDADGYVKDVNKVGLCGATDWKLPNDQDLQSILNRGLVGIALVDPTFFPNSFKGDYWSSTSTAEQFKAWLVGFGTGNILPTNRTTMLAVRLVRKKNPPNNARYTVSADLKEVIDNFTGLTWKRCAQGLSGDTCDSGAALEFSSWFDALADAVATGNGWRLPNANELSSLPIRSAPDGGRLDHIVFPNDPASAMWTSTPVADATPGTYIWYVDFYSGLLNVSGPFSMYARLVRTSDPKEVRQGWSAKRDTP